MPIGGLAAALVVAVVAPARAHDGASPLAVAVRGDTIVATWTVGGADAAELREQLDRDGSGTLDDDERGSLAELLARRAIRALGLPDAERLGAPALDLTGDAIRVRVTVRSAHAREVKPNTGDPRHRTRVALLGDPPRGAGDTDLGEAIADLVGLGKVLLFAGVGSL